MFGGTMSSSSLSLADLVLTVVCVLLSCAVGTLLAVCFIRSRLTRNYLYCPPCSRPIGLFPVFEDPLVEARPRVEARPWVEVVSHNVPHNSQHLPIRQDSATFKRLGMRSGQADPQLPVLSAAQLETKPLSSPQALPVGGQRNKIISPTSAEVLARRDTKLSRLSSRRTLQFLSPAEAELSAPRQVRRSVAERSERRSRQSSRREVGEDGSGSAQTVIRVGINSKNRKPSASRGETAKYKNNNREIIPEQNLARDGGFDNPVYESASQDDRSTSFMSPPQVSVSPPRPSVINQLRA